MSKMVNRINGQNPGRPVYYIVKAAGENFNEETGEPTFAGSGAVDYFVATNRPYFIKGLAIKEAQRLAQETPGNRYYVTTDIYGVMAHAPKLEEKVY